MFRIIKQKLHRFLKFDHSECLPKDCEINTKLANTYEPLWREIDHVYERGPCTSYPHGSTGWRLCTRCRMYELACNIREGLADIKEWGKE